MVLGLGGTPANVLMMDQDSDKATCAALSLATPGGGLAVNKVCSSTDAAQEWLS
jgi:hypothetical protein